MLEVPVRSLLLDIEGTTTPVSFVYEVLFPYARRHMERFLQQYAAEPAVRADLEALRQLNARDHEQGLNPPPLDDRTPQALLDSLLRYARWLMDKDSKAAPLKSLQGRIWELGYQKGELRGQVFPEVPKALARWKEQGRDISVFSSGSVRAQKLLFAHSEFGDLTKFFRTYFDTSTGPKGEAESYRRIAAALGRTPRDVLFVSDITTELQAAQAADLQVLLCIRPGHYPQLRAGPFSVCRSFDEIFP